MIKTLPADVLERTEDFYNGRFRIVLEDGMTYQDIFRPQFWAACAHRLKRYDTIRMIGHEDAFDIEVTVLAIGQSGARVRLRGKEPSHLEEPKVDLENSVRIEFLEATRWRLIGLSNAEIKRGMTKPEAEKALKSYLLELGMA